MGKRCLRSRPRGPAPNVSPARKGWETESEEDPSAGGAAHTLRLSLGTKPTSPALSRLAVGDLRCCGPLLKNVF
jgi:hypothetical protein